MSLHLKLQCPCGARFAFEVEPVEGRMPVPVHCPVCGIDATDLANAELAAWGKASTATESSGGPKVRLRVHSPEPHPVALPPPNHPSAPNGPCPQHPGEVAVDRCRVCGRPICQRCLERYGFVCSVLCQGRAEREGIPLPCYTGRRDLMTARHRRWTRRLALLAATFLALIAGTWIWWKWVETTPRVVFEASLEGREPSSWQLLSPDELLVLGPREAILRRLPEGRILWQVRWPEAETVEFPRLVKRGPVLVWLRGDRLEAVDPATGQRKWEVRFPTPLTGFRSDEFAAVAVSGPAGGPRSVTRVELATGTVERQQILPAPTPPALRTSSSPATRPARVPTAADSAAFLEDEPDQPDTAASPRHEFYPAGSSIVEFQSWLIQRHILLREGLKPREGGSVLDTDQLTVGRSFEAVAELLNEMQRARTGGTVKEDRSRYGVRLRRWTAGRPTEWTGEVTGVPWWVPLTSVDVLLAATQMMVFEKTGRLLWSTTLAWPVSPEVLQKAEQTGTGWPCLEHEALLFVFDQGMLTCFERDSGRVRWRLPSVGISRIHLHDRTAIYVCTTTATVDDLAHPLEVKLGHKPQPLLLKVEAATGRILWRQARLADHCLPTGRYLYAWRLSRGLHGEGAFFNLYRLDPQTGSPLWHEYAERWPRWIDFQGHRFCLQWEDRVEVRSFRSP